MDSQAITGHTRLSSQAIAHRQTKRRGFNLIESAIVLGVVGLVIGGIWVAASAVKHRRYEQKFLEGFLVLKDKAPKYLKQGDTCGVGSLNWVNPEIFALLYPEQWEEIELGGSLTIQCEGVSTGFPNEKYLRLTIWDPPNFPYLYNNIFPKLDALCSRSGDCYLDMGMMKYHYDRWPGLTANPNLDIRIGRN